MSCTYTLTTNSAKLDVVALFYATQAIRLPSIASRVIRRLYAKTVDEDSECRTTTDDDSYEEISSVSLRALRASRTYRALHHPPDSKPCWIKRLTCCPGFGAIDCDLNDSQTGK
jgi:hypothetical protein